MKFWRITPPTPEKPRCLVLTENIRWGYILLIQTLRRLLTPVNREFVAKRQKPLALPTQKFPSPSRGVETFFDGVKFDPDDPTAYLKSLKIKSLIEGSGIKVGSGERPAVVSSSTLPPEPNPQSYPNPSHPPD